ncbi:hypothetical protein CKAN_01994000 [Cinnamomum micranthum f. kanehirae]|uniref:Uncharacterized protein n=1 Tax=Cinnamomum micranthum f. kanehirae TaxID=337451 RepID=A0A3S3NMT6_9MAGN|nr:hypothetical protein CKAN_01994000 [Cinnamomum micranthum f. kanehirae]
MRIYNSSTSISLWATIRFILGVTSYFFWFLLGIRGTNDGNDSLILLSFFWVCKILLLLRKIAIIRCMSKSLDNCLEPIVYVDCNTNAILIGPLPSKPSPTSSIAPEWRRASHDLIVDSKQDKIGRESDVHMLKSPT